MAKRSSDRTKQNMNETDKNPTSTTGEGAGRVAGVGDRRTNGHSRMRTTLRLYGLIVCIGLGMVWFDSKMLIHPLRESIIGTANLDFQYEYDDARNDEDDDDETPTDHDNANYDDNGIHRPVPDEAPSRTTTVNQKQTQTQNQAAQDHQEDIRPILILHVGPPKTGTTTIQEGLKVYAHELAGRDNYYFIGQSIEKTQFTVPAPTNTTTTELKTKTTYNTFQMKELFYAHDDVCKELVHHLQQQHNVILSSEHFISQFGRVSWSRLYNTIFLRTPSIGVDQQRGGGRNKNRNNRNHHRRRLAQRNRASRETNTPVHDEDHEPYFGFKVKIVVTYRHFFQWLPSYYFQLHSVWLGGGGERNQNTPGIASWSTNYISNLHQYIYKDDNPNEDNEQYQQQNDYDVAEDSLSYTYYKNSTKKNLPEVGKVHGSIWGYLIWSEQFLTPFRDLYHRVDVFDIHQQELPNTDGHNSNTKRGNTDNDMFMNFICQMIPTANSTCQYLIEQQHEQEKGKGHQEYERTSRKTNQYLSLQDKGRIVQLARFGITDGARLPPEFNTNSSSVISEFDFNNTNFLSLAHNIERWIQTKMSNDDRNRNNSTNYKYNKNNNASFDIQDYMICLDDNTQRKLGEISWNFLIQQLLLVKMHAPYQQPRIGASNSLSSLFQSSIPTDHLILSSQFDFENELYNNNDNKNKQELLLNLSKLEPLKVQHDASFQEYVQRGVFCQIDPLKMLQNNDFIASVFDPKKYRKNKSKQQKKKNEKRRGERGKNKKQQGSE